MSDNIIESLMRDKDRYIGRLSTIREKLANARNNNNKREDYLNRLDIFKNMHNEVCLYRNKLDIIYKRANDDYADFKKSRMSMIEGYLDKNLALVFPDKNYTSTIDCDFSHRKNRLDLTLVDEKGNRYYPQLNEGGLCKQLVSFSSTSAICICLQKNKLYMDESFSASAPTNLSKISVILNELCAKGFQCFLIQQTDYIYKDIPRREIYIKRDEVTNETKILSIKDY